MREGGFLFSDHRNSIQYQTEFSVYLEEATTLFYSRKREELLEKYVGPQYARQVKTLIERERRLCERSLPAISHDVIMGIMKRELLVNVEPDRFLEQRGVGVVHMMANKQFEELKIVWEIHNGLNGCLQSIADIMNKWIREEGHRIVSADDLMKQGKWSPVVDDLLTLHDHASTMLTDCFNEAPMMKRSLGNAFESFCNKTMPSGVPGVAEMIAKRVNAMLKTGREKGETRMTEEETEGMLESICKLLNHVKEMDIFCSWTEKYMARRLLDDRFISLHLEQTMVKLVKVVLGGGYTRKLERMITDLEASAELNDQFSKWCANDGLDKMDTEDSSNKEKEKEKKEMEDGKGDDAMVLDSALKEMAAVVVYKKERYEHIQFRILTTGFWPDG
eukprot:TRINITY_DN5436_c0_g1_i2.p1 TRINITY_DN5436_c0_g1~~TRINITY_DN5436_c0_g1_i2.p1  ORF type:complete len:390 (+),score=126.68 TRINITY_DN5436_c0_g1_i2:359-1528(+)